MDAVHTGATGLKTRLILSQVSLPGRPPNMPPLVITGLCWQVFSGGLRGALEKNL